jgi:hypothetical protein
MQNIKSLMSDHYELLTELNTIFCQEHGSLLFTDLPRLQHSFNNADVSNESITYDSPLIEIRNYFPPAHTIPKSDPEIQYIDIGISLKHITIQDVTSHIQDPILRLDGFDIVLKTQHFPNYYIASWHLDKRIVSPSYSVIEPEYHFTFGGRKMEELYATNWDFGSSLIMRAPRIMHPPMDIILGIDFILTQFIPNEYSNIFVANKKYKAIVNKMKQVLWKPYAIALAKNFYSSWTDVEGLTFDDTFCKNIIG